MFALIDTHCHIHDSDYDFLIADVLKQAQLSKIIRMICVGTSLKSSKEALEFSSKYKPCFFSLALHPHEAIKPQAVLEEHWQKLLELANLAHKSSNLVAIGECGLDYFYHSDLKVKQRQLWLFEQHLILAKQLQLPVIFHVRQAFPDFWKLYQTYSLPGVLHSFSDTKTQVKVSQQFPNLYIGLNGIMTFTKDLAQLEAAKAINLNRLLLETDAPYLTPAPYRGRPNQPHYLQTIASFLANLRGDDLQTLATATTKNAQTLFGFKIASSS